MATQTNQPGSEHSGSEHSGWGRQGLDANYYLDESIFAAEQEKVFARTWQLVGHVSQVANPGQLFTAKVGTESVIIANDKGNVTCFFNVCQHRGHELVPTEPSYYADAEERSSAHPGFVSRNIKGALLCPYHAWTYDLGGKLLRARGADVGEICVPQVRHEVMAGFIFVNLAANAPTLAETLPGIDAELLAIAPVAPTRVLTATLTYDIAANWKIAVENYNECYHCPNVHKAFTAGVVDPASYRITPRGNCIHHTATAPDLSALGYTRQHSGDDYGSFFVWPVSSIQCYPGQVLNTFRWVPLAIDRTLLIRQWWFDGSEPTEEQQEIIDLDWQTTVAEDFDIMDSVQRGIQSRGYVPGPLIESGLGAGDVHSEDAVPHLQDLLREALGD